MAITFTFASMKQTKAPQGWNKKGESSFSKISLQLGVILAFGLLVGLLVGALAAFIFYFLIINKLIKMEGDLKLSLDIFFKKKKDLSGIDNPMGIEEESEVSVKTEANIDTMEVGLCQRDIDDILIIKCFS